MAKIANVALTNTFDTWRTRSNEAFDRLSNFAINNSSLYANTLTANVSFTSKGLATMQGRATVGTNLTVSGNTTLGAAGKVANATGWFGVNGRQSISTNLFVGANIYVMGSMGIGTSSPSTKLVINGGTGTSQIRWNVSGSTFVEEVTTNAAQSAYLYKSNDASYHVWKVTGTERMRIDSSGLVTACNSLAVTQNLTVSGNTTLNGTTIDKSHALSQTLTDGATINWDVSLGRVATVTLGAAGRTMAAPTNLKVGTYILRVYQDATGSRTITTWNSVFKWTAAVAPVLSTGANKLDIITFFSDGTNLYGSYLPDMR